jgi:hypothetical protein
MAEVREENKIHIATMFHLSEQRTCKTEGMANRWDELLRGTDYDNSRVVDHH